MPPINFCIKFFNLVININENTKMIKNQNHLGGICMILSVLFFSLMDVLIKITHEYDVGQVMFSRALFGLIPIFFLIPKERLKNFYKTKYTGLHFYRSFVGAIAMYAIFVGLRNLELAEVTSMAFSGPIWVVIFSILFLREKVRLTRWLAVGLGFMGVLIISKPGFDNLNFYYIYPIIFCLGLSYVAIAIRKLSSTEPVWLISFFFSFSIMLLSFLSFYQNWILPSLIDLFLLSMVGILGGLATLWLSQSYKYSEVSLVSPLKYLGLVFAIIFGYFIWNEVPSIKTLIGAFLVITSSIIIFRREITLKKQVTVPRHD